MKKIMTVFGVILIVFAVVLYNFAPDKNFSALEDVRSMLEENYGTVTMREAEKSILRGERYVLSFCHVLDVSEDDLLDPKGIVTSEEMKAAFELLEK